MEKRNQSINQDWDNAELFGNDMKYTFDHATPSDWANVPSVRSAKPSVYNPVYQANVKKAMKEIYSKLETRVKK
jgi:hypothetical protein